MDAWDGKVLSSADLQLDLNTEGLHYGLRHDNAPCFCYILLSCYTQGFTIHGISYPSPSPVLSREQYEQRNCRPKPRTIHLNFKA